MAYVSAGITADTKAWDGVSGALPPASDVLFRVDDVKQEASPKKGTPQLVLDCVVVTEGELKDRKAMHRFVIGPNMKPASIGRLKQLLDACGIQADSNGGFDSDHLKGRVFIADIVVEPYNQTDPVTGQTLEKSSSRLQNERPYRNQAAPGAQPQAQPQPQQGFAPQQNFAPQQPQQGYAQPAPQGYPQQPQQGYAPVGAPQMGAPSVAPAAMGNGQPQYPAPGRGAPGVTPVG
jgi:hypothetical protein